MSNIQIVTDSTAYFTKEEAKKYNIVVVPLSVCFEGEEFQEGFLDETGDFFERLERSKDFPTTSQPSAGAFASVYNEALKEGKEVLAIIFSSKISGTYNSAVLGAEMLESDKISVIDTHTSVGNLKHLVLEAHRMAEDGRSRQRSSTIEDQNQDGNLSNGRQPGLPEEGRKIIQCPSIHWIDIKYKADHSDGGWDPGRGAKTRVRRRP